MLVCLFPPFFKGNFASTWFVCLLFRKCETNRIRSSRKCQTAVRIYTSVPAHISKNYTGMQSLDSPASIPGQWHGPEPIPWTLPGLVCRLCRPAINRTPSCLSWAATGFRVLVKTQGAHARPNGRHLNRYVRSLSENLRKTLSSSRIGSIKYASFRANFAIQSPALSRSFRTWMPSILKCSVCTNVFKDFI